MIHSERTTRENSDLEGTLGAITALVGVPLFLLLLRRLNGWLR